MSTWLLRLAPVLAYVVLAILLWMQHQKIESQTATIQSYGDRIERQAKNIESLSNTMTSYGPQLAALSATQNGIRASLSARQREIEELKRDNQEFKVWADLPLPDAVVRLRERPALTGANDYSERLRASSAVQPVPGVGQDKRRPEQPH